MWLAKVSKFGSDVEDAQNGVQSGVVSETANNLLETMDLLDWNEFKKQWKLMWPQNQTCWSSNLNWQ